MSDLSKRHNLKFYTGIGSRETPEIILKLMALIATQLEIDGWILRSGAAPGADTGFENGIKNDYNKDIYLPWYYFNDNKSKLYNVSDAAKEMAAPHHDYWNGLKPAVKKLMGRNAYQVLGYQLDKKTKFVLCWTPDGCESRETRNKKTGGTGLAISLADSLDIPIYNLANVKTYNKIVENLNILKFPLIKSKDKILLTNEDYEYMINNQLEV